MSSIVDSLYELKYNPFEHGPYLASFYAHLHELENSFLLAQLVVPLCSHPIYNNKLFNSKKTSSIWTVFDDRKKLYDLQERIDGFQALTKQCIEYCLINDWLSFNEQRLSLDRCDGAESTFSSQKSAEKLGLLFRGHSVVEIFAFLGAKPR